MNGVILKRFEQPDETREFEYGKIGLCLKSHLLTRLRRPMCGGGFAPP